MRFYVFSSGPPGYITAEVAVRDLEGADEARAWAADEWAHNGRLIISEAKALMRPAYRQALERWERQDDAVLQDTEVAEIRASRRREASYFAELGCSDAATAIAEGDDEQIRVVINEHCHDERCGGRDFPDEPRVRRALNVVR